MEGLSSLTTLVEKLVTVPGIQSADVVNITTKWFGAYHAYVRKSSQSQVVVSANSSGVLDAVEAYSNVEASDDRGTNIGLSVGVVQHDVDSGSGKSMRLVDSGVLNGGNMSDGYCYLRAIRTNRRLDASVKLGSRPKFSALMLAPASWFRPLKQLQNLKVSGSSPVWHLGRTGNVDLLTVLSGLSKEVRNVSRGTLCARIQDSGLNIQGVYGFGLHHRLGSTQRYVADLTVGHLGGMTYPQGYCYLRAVDPRSHFAAANALGSYPKVSAIVNVPGKWFLSNEDLMSLTLVSTGPVYHVTENQMHGVNLLNALIYTSSRAPILNDLSLAERLLTARIGVPKGFSFDVTAKLGADKQLLPRHNDGLGLFLGSTMEGGVNQSVAMLGDLYSIDNQENISANDVSYVYNALLQCCKRDFGVTVDVRVKYASLRALVVPGLMDCVVYQADYDIIGWLPVEAKGMIPFALLNGPGNQADGRRNVSVFPVPRHIYPILQDCMFGHVVGHMNSAYDDMEKLFYAMDRKGCDYQYLATKFIICNTQY